MRKIDFRRCNIIAMFFSPYTLHLANCVELVYAQYPKFLLLKRFFKWALPGRLNDCEIKISNFFFPNIQRLLHLILLF